MRPALAALAAVLVCLSSAGPASAQAAPPPAPRTVGTGITMVPGAAGAAPVRAPVEAPAPAPAAPPAPAQQQPQTAGAAALERQDAFIKRSVMQSICRGC